MYDIRNKVGIVFQNPDNQFIGATVADDIAFGLENHQVPTEKMQDIIERYAEKVNMRKYLNSEPTRLSGGQKQTCSNCRSLGYAAGNFNFTMNPQVCWIPKEKQKSMH